MDHKEGAYKVRDLSLAEAGRKRIEWAESRMPVLMLVVFLVGFGGVFVACDNTYTTGEAHVIREAFPNPARVGDTVTVVIEEVSAGPTPVDTLSEIEVSYSGGLSRIPLPVTGAYVNKIFDDAGEFVPLGEFRFTPQIDSLIQYGYLSFVQFEVVPDLPTEGLLSARLAEQPMENRLPFSILP